MQKIDKKTADAYFRTRTTLIVIYLAIGFCVSYGVVLFAEPLSSITFLNMPLHYYMGAQGAVLTFIFLLFVNAIVSDYVDKKYGLLDLDKEKETDTATDQAADK